MGGGGDCMTFVTGLEDFGVGMLPLDVDLDCGVVLRLGRAIMKNGSCRKLRKVRNPVRMDMEKGGCGDG